ncbi:MAG: YjfA family protein [Caldilineales bacterium]|nr:YjfA family protein [Caldilineales bacterium]
MYSHDGVARNRSWRWLALAAIAVAMLMAALPQIADAASGPRCRGVSCRGKNPQTMGCSRDAVTLDITPKPGTAGAGYNQYTELRYSRRCQAYWSRVRSRLPAGSIVFTRAAIKGHTQQTRVVNPGGTQAISRMWTGPAVACGVSVAKSDPSYMPVGCAGEAP